MKTTVDRVVVAILVLAAAVMAAGCNRSTTEHASFTVEGMHCESCSRAITEALEKIDGVERASADHAAGSAEASFSTPTVTAERLTTEIEGLGYTVTAVKTTPSEG